MYSISHSDLSMLSALSFWRTRSNIKVLEGLKFYGKKGIISSADVCSGPTWHANREAGVPSLAKAGKCTEIWFFMFAILSLMIRIDGTRMIRRKW